MRRRIDLYIAGTLADLSDQSFVLFNYSLTDLEKPSAVKNSWSQSVTLPGTPQNALIFDHIARVDRRTGTGFNASQKTPFSIYDESGRILEQGYLRLNEVTRKGCIVTGYKVSLFGGLGDFFYGLSYSDGGDKLTLADLDYLGTPNPESELDFAINATAVSDAWTRLFANITGTTVSQKWDVVNFAPCYEGFPEGDFDAAKAYAIRSDLGLSLHGASTYQDLTGEGGTIVTLPEPIDGWASQEFRSYLQRPVLNMNAFLVAVQRRAAKLGYTFDYSSITNRQKHGLWKTLPAIPSLGSFRKSGGDLTGTLSASPTTAEQVGTWTLSGLDSMVGIQVAATLAFYLRWNTSVYNYTAKLHNASRNKAALFFVQALAYAGNVLVGGSDVLLIGPDTTILNANNAAMWLGYEPTWETSRYTYYGTQPVATQTGQYGIDGSIVLRVDAESVTRYVLRVTAYNAVGNFYSDVGAVTGFDGGGSGSVPPTVWDENGDPQSWATCLLQANTGSTSFTYSRPDQPRSGAAITKAMLLSSKHTPAEYLVSLAKLYGWVFVTDPAEKTITVRTRDAFYSTGLGTIDLSDRIDRSQGISITPLYHSAKWYSLGHEVAPSAFATEYAKTYGRNYGWMRVDTGYDFDAADVNLLEGSAYRSAACILAHGPYWYAVTQSSAWRPPQFLYSGCKYTLKKNADGSLVDFDIDALPNTVTVTALNSDHPGYDRQGISRPELRDAEGKGVDAEDILLKLDGSEFYARFAITDDTAGMLQANGGKPCWYWPLRSSTLRVPTFTRYTYPGGEDVNALLDFSIPAEVDIPEIVFNPASTAYVRGWQKYLGDLLDVDTKVLRCKVDLSGLPVGQELLRRFFWYEGCTWVLNKVSNYSLTTYDPAECEFVQVQDITNYTNGQTW